MFDYYDDIYKSACEEGFKSVLVREIMKHQADGETKAHDHIYREYYLRFNKAGKLNQVFFHISWNEDEEPAKRQYVYDMENRLVSSIKICLGTNRVIALCHFDYYRNGKMKSKNYYSFDDEGNCDLHRKESFRYEGFMVHTKILMEMADWSITERITHIYDEKGNLVEKKTTGKINAGIWDKFEYDKDNNLCKQASLDENGIPVSYRIVETTREENQVIEKITIGPETKILLYEYEKNEKGHWTEQRIYEDGIHRKTTTRKIEYY